MTVHVNKPAIAIATLTLIVLIFGSMLLFTKCSSKASEPAQTVQVTQPVSPVAQTGPGNDTIQGVRRNDTSRVVILYKVSGGDTKWKNGYSVTRIFFADERQAVNRGYTLLDENKQGLAIPQESVLGAFPNDWK